MSNQLPNNQTTEEVDIGQIFFYIEKLFKKIGQLITKLFYGLVWLLKRAGLLFLFSLGVAKKHVLKIALGGILAYALFYFLDKRQIPVYQSNILINQNFDTGKLLYNNIARYNALARNTDSIALSRELGIKPEVAAKIVGFDIEGDINRNNLYIDYHEFSKSVDSTIYVSFFEYRDQYAKEDLRTQTVSVLSIEQDVYDGLGDALVNVFQDNDYFKEKQRKELAVNQSIISAYMNILKESDTLQKQYISLLQNYYGNSEDPNKSSSTTVNLNLANKDKVNTNEFALFKEQKTMKIQITELQKELDDKAEIIEMQSDFTQPVLVENKYKKNKKIATVIGAFLVFFFFFLKEIGFFTLIEEYGNKENLFEL